MDSTDIYEYLLKQDSERKKLYLNQQSISNKMRSTIVDLIINLDQIIYYTPCHLAI